MSKPVKEMIIAEYEKRFADIDVFDIELILCRSEQSTTFNLSRCVLNS